jgi:hypothetical protein
MAALRQHPSHMPLLGLVGVAVAALVLARAGEAAELRRLDQALARWGRPQPLEALLDLRAEAARLEGEARLLEERIRGLPPTPPGCDDTAAELEELEMTVAPFLALWPHPKSAEEAWRRARAEEENARAGVSVLGEEIWHAGRGPDGLPPTVGALRDWWRGEGPDRWASWLAEAHAWQEGQARVRDLERRLSELDGRRRTLAAEAAALAATATRYGPPLAACAPGPESDPASIRDRARAASEKIGATTAALVAEEKTLSAILAGFGVDVPGGGAEAAAATLQDRAVRADDRVHAAIRELEALAAAHAGLPPAADAIDPDHGRGVLADLERRIRDGEPRLRRARDLQEEARRDHARLEGAAPLNVASAELELVALELEEARVGEEVEALRVAHEALKDAVATYQSSHRLRLEAALSRCFAVLAHDRGPARMVVLDDAFSLLVRESDGRLVRPEQLSQGARDQLSIALRLAVADLLGDGVRLPLVLDDPFVHYDPERLARIRALLSTAASERQIVLLTHRPELVAWGAEIREGRTVEAVQGAAP